MHRKDKKWNFTVFAPTCLCTDRGWNYHSNVVVAAIHRDSNPPPIIQEIEEGGPPYRRDLLEKYVNNSTQGRVLDMKRANEESQYQLLHPLLWRFEKVTSKTTYLKDSQVQIYSQATNFVPLFSMPDDCRKIVLTDVSSEPPGPCPVIKINKSLGVAAFLENPKDKGQVEDFWGKQYKGTAQLLSNNLIISETDFQFSYSAHESPEVKQVSAGLYETIFASYAHEDRLVVESVESIMQAFRLGELRWDTRVLRAGEKWQNRIYDEIKSADSFQLFWSEHAKKSQNVRKEWMYALTLDRDGFIKPVYWSDPLPIPPLELEGIHFASIKLPHKSSSIIDALRHLTRRWTGAR